MIERERRRPGVLREVEFRGGEDPGIDGTLVGAEFGFGKFNKQTGPFFRGKFTDIAHDGGGPVKASGKPGRVIGFGAEEFGVVDLELTDLIGVSGRDATSGRATSFMTEDMDAIVFPSQVEDAVGHIAHHAAFIDEQSGEDGDADFFKRKGFPESLARIGHDARAEGEAGDIMFGDAAGEKVEFQARYRVA